MIWREGIEEEEKGGKAEVGGEKKKSSEHAPLWHAVQQSLALLQRPLGSDRPDVGDLAGDEQLPRGDDAPERAEGATSSRS